MLLPASPSSLDRQLADLYTTHAVLYDAAFSWDEGAHGQGSDSGGGHEMV